MLEAGPVSAGLRVRGPHTSEHGVDEGQRHLHGPHATPPDGHYGIEAHGETVREQGNDEAGHDPVGARAVALGLHG